MKNKEDYIQMQDILESTTDILLTQFVLSFILNLLLKGVMSQLWSIFNTLQIILALPLLAVLMPSNILIVEKTVNGIINFKPIDPDVVYNSVITPVFGSSETDEANIEGDQSGKQGIGGDEANLLKQVLLFSIIFIALVLLITVLYICKKKVLPRCCPCFQKLVTQVLSKLMFNSVIRSCMQTYLLTCISMWIQAACSLRHVSTHVNYAVCDM